MTAKTCRVTVHVPAPPGGWASNSGQLVAELSTPLDDTSLQGAQGRWEDGPRIVQLDRAGFAQIVVVCNDAPEVAPQGSTWKLWTVVNGQIGPYVIEPYVISTAFAATVDLSSLTPASGTNIGVSGAWGQSSSAKFSGSGSPVGVVTPSAAGDLYVDDTTPALWQATGTAKTDWQQNGTSVQGIPPAPGSQPFAQGSTGDGTGTVTASGYCGFAQGYATRSGAITAVVGFAQGYAASGSIDVTGYGAFGSGVVFDAGSAIKATNSGSFAQGCARMTGTIQSTGVGGFAQGYADEGGIVEAATGALAAGSATAPSAILSAGPFSTTLGHATGAGASITSSGGGFAVGTAGAGGSLIASASGSFARGFAAQSGTIQATNQGSFAAGLATGTTDQGVITSSGYGSFAHGYAYANGGATAITASGKGSFAHGYVKAGSIVASADNAAQFGPGTNAQADSMQIGNGGIRLLGKAAAQPQTTYQNGDIWVGADGHVKVRSNGATVSL